MEGRGGALRRLALAAAGRRFLLLLLDSIGRAGPPRAEIGRRIERRKREKEKERKKVNVEAKKSAVPLSTLFFARPLPLPLGAFFVFEGCCRDDSDQWFCRIAGS